MTFLLHRYVQGKRKPLSFAYGDFVCTAKVRGRHLYVFAENVSSGVCTKVFKCDLKRGPGSLRADTSDFRTWISEVGKREAYMAIGDTPFAMEACTTRWDWEERT